MEKEQVDGISVSDEIKAACKDIKADLAKIRADVKILLKRKGELTGFGDVL